jgi:hypothetical protein
VEDRAGLEVEAAVLGTEHVGSGDVRRQQIRRELDPMGVPLEGTPQGLDGRGLGQPRRSLHQDVAVCQQADQQPLYQGRLAEHLPGEMPAQSAEGGVRAGLPGLEVACLARASVHLPVSLASRPRSARFDHAACWGPRTAP